MKRILIIDDEEKIRNIFKEVFIREGFEVLLAKDATEGTFKMIASENIDLILLDINMPEINGGFMREVIEEYNRDYKIIVSSVYSIDEQKTVIPDAYDYYDKAQGIDLLLEKVKKALQCSV